MATGKLNPYRRTNVENRWKGDDPTANPLADKVAGVKGAEASPDGEDAEDLLGEELGELMKFPSKSKSSGISSIEEDELTTDEMLAEEPDEEAPPDVDPKLWAKAQEQAEAAEGLGTNEKYVKFLYTELQEEEAGVDLDGDGEAGESVAHKESVLETEAPPGKKSKSFFSLMGYGKK